MRLGMAESDSMFMLYTVYTVYTVYRSESTFVQCFIRNSKMCCKSECHAAESNSAQ